MFRLLVIDACKKWSLLILIPFYYRHRHSHFWCPLSLLSLSRPAFVLSAPVEDQHGLPLGERYPWEVSQARSGYVP